MRNWDGRLAIVLSLVAILLVLASCSDDVAPTVPPAPLTIEAARQALDEAALEVTRANQALWRLGVRDVVSPLHVDTAIAPTYLRLPRGGR